MTTNIELQGIQLAAALAEQIYRRSSDASAGESDHPVTLSDLGARSINLDGVVDGQIERVESLGDPNDEDVYYYSPYGFVGRVVLKDNTLYVVFRGTDSAESFSSGANKAAGAAWNPTALDTPGKLSDIGDWVTNISLGTGTVAETQLDHPLALTQAAKVLAAQEGYDIKVVGQSLGGGLAGLVSMIENVHGYAIAPAPFNPQMHVEASIKAISTVLGISRAEVKEWADYTYNAGGAGGGGIPQTITVAAGLRDGGYSLVDLIQFNIPGLSTSQFDSILNLRNAFLDSVGNLLEIHTIAGEILSDGLNRTGFAGGHFV